MVDYFNFNVPDQTRRPLQVGKRTAKPSSNKDTKVANLERMKLKQEMQGNLVQTAEEKKDKKGKKKRDKKQNKKDKKRAHVTENDSRVSRVSLLSNALPTDITGSFSLPKTKAEPVAVTKAEPVAVTHAKDAEKEEEEESEDDDEDSEEEETNPTVFSDNEERKQSVFIDQMYRYVGDHKTFNYVGKTFNILRNERGDVTGHEPQPSVKKPGTVTLVYFVYTQRRISLM